MLTSLKILLNNFLKHHPKLTTFFTILILGFILTVIFTWPMIFKLPVFYSDESDYTLIGWIMWYNQLSLISGRIFSSTDYFNAFQFYPWPYALAFSEHMFFPSVLFSPIYWITNELVLSVNLYTFFTFILTFISSFYVFKKIIHNIYASVIAATIYTFNPITAAHFPGHTHLLGKFFLPIIFLTTINFFSKPSFKNGFQLGLVFSLNALTSINFFIISIPSIILTSLPFLIVNFYKLNTQYLRKILLTIPVFLIFIPLFIHFILPYQNFSKQEGASRGINESVFFSAQPIDWILPFPESLLYKKIIAFYDPVRIGYPKINYSEHTLGLNILPVVLFLFGAFYLDKKNPFSSRIWNASLILTAFGTFLLTFGPLWDTTKSPYYYFNYLTGILNGIRVPTRFQFFFYIPFSLIAGFGFLAVSKYLKVRPLLIFFIILLTLTLESFNNWQFMSDTSSLTEKPPVFQAYQSFSFLKDSTTLHFPIQIKNFEKQIYYLQLSTIHHERLVNGYSGYFPPDWVELITEIETNLDENMLKKLSALKIDFLILHKDRLNPDYLDRLKAENSLIKDLIYFEDTNYLILSLKHPYLKTNPCFLSRDIDISLIPKSESFGLTPTYFNQVKISNTGDCYFTNILNNRYLETSFFINKYYNLNLKMPAVLGPKEEIFLK